MLYPLLYQGSLDLMAQVVSSGPTDPPYLRQPTPDGLLLWPLGDPASIFAQACWPQDFISLPTAIIALAGQKHCTLGTAESCTGGLVASLLTDVSGSSQVMQGGVVSYANEVKLHVLGVPEATLKQHGAVSKEVAAAMAAGAARALNAELTISFSGIAGPGGGSPQKPVGTVAIGLCQHGMAQAQMLHFAGDRLALKKQFAMQGLWQLWTALKQWA